MATFSLLNERLEERACAPVIDSVSAAVPFQWLRAGWRDFMAAPIESLTYGAIFALSCAASAGLSRELSHHTLVFFTGLLLMGPFLAAGTYTAAYQIEKRESVSIARGIGLIWKRASNLGLFILLLALITATWVRFSVMLFPINFTMLEPAIEAYTITLADESKSSMALAYLAGIGMLLALIVFVISAVAIPAILDRNCGPVTAIRVSVAAVRTNWQAMMVWAALILTTSAVGLATHYITMVVIFPVLGYATWHCYHRTVYWFARHYVNSARPADPMA